MDGVGGVRVDGKTKLTGQPESPEEPQGVLLHSPVRIPYAADQPSVQILLTAKPVDQSLRTPRPWR